MHRSILIGAILATLVTMQTVSSGAARKTGRGRNGASEQVTERGRIDWSKGVLFATGMGAISQKEANQSKAYLRARTYAKLDALRNLLMLVDHVRIDSRTTAADFEAANDEIKAEVKGIVRGAQIVDEKERHIRDRHIVEVTVATAMYGDQGIASVLLPEAFRRNQEAEDNSPEEDNESGPVSTRPGDSEVMPEAAPPALPAAREHNHGRDTLKRDEIEPEIPAPPLAERYTSLIIDARGLGVERCMSPKIRQPDSSEVWGTVRVNLDWLIEHGIVVYALTVAEAKQHERAGSSPLIVRAVGRAGGPFNCDAVVSPEDADRILRANVKDRFLDNYRVIFVVDPGRH